MYRTKGLTRWIFVGLVAAILLPTAVFAQDQKDLDSRDNLDPRFPITAPVSTWWHELWPTYSNLYHLSSWQDNGDGYLSPSDIIDLTDTSGTVSYWHVDVVTITIFLTHKNDPNWHTMADFLGPFEFLANTMYNPVSTEWEWIPPGTGGFHLSSWDDNGDGYLSESDQIDITDWATGQISYWHVDRVTTDIIISPEPASFAMVGVGLAGLLGLRRFRKK